MGRRKKNFFKEQFGGPTNLEASAIARIIQAVMWSFDNNSTKAKTPIKNELLKFSDDKIN